MSRSGARPPSQRQLRVSEEVRHALAAVFLRRELRDPDLVDVDLTVTEVRISPDLKAATAFIAPLGGSDAASLKPVLKALRRAAPYLRGEVSKLMRLKFAPALSFQAETAFDTASRIDALLHDPHVAQDLAREDDADADVDAAADDAADAEDAGAASADEK